jgi:hypothetical protein
MDGDADVLGAADGAAQERRQIIMHRPMIRPELGLQRFQVEKGALSIADGIVAVYGNALATVYAFLDGGHRSPLPGGMTSSLQGYPSCSSEPTKALASSSTFVLSRMRMSFRPSRCFWTMETW